MKTKIIFILFFAIMLYCETGICQTDNYNSLGLLIFEKTGPGKNYYIQNTLETHVLITKKQYKQKAFYETLLSIADTADSIIRTSEGIYYGNFDGDTIKEIITSVSMTNQDTFSGCYIFNRKNRTITIIDSDEYVLQNLTILDFDKDGLDDIQIFFGCGGSLRSGTTGTLFKNSASLGLTLVAAWTYWGFPLGYKDETGLYNEVYEPGIKDLDGDGNCELLIQTNDVGYSGEYFCYDCESCWINILKWDGKKFIKVNKKFPEIYKKLIKIYELEKTTSFYASCKEMVAQGASEEFWCPHEGCLMFDKAIEKCKAIINKK